MAKTSRQHPRSTARRSRPTSRPTSKRWSSAATRSSNALDLESSVFTQNNPRTVARPLKRSAERSRRRKGTPYQSTVSMLTFYINLAGKGLPASKRRVLMRAKDELRKAFGRT